MISGFDSTDISEGISSSSSQEFDLKLSLQMKMTSENHNSFRFNFKIDETGIYKCFFFLILVISFLENNNLNNEQLSNQALSSSEINSLLQLNGLDYCDEVKEKLYPNKFFKLTHPFYFLQVHNLSRKLMCLLCISKMDFNQRVIKGHLSGKKHNFNLTGAYSNNCSSYHTFWMSQVPEVQVQQQYFTPLGSTCFNCSVCLKVVSIDKIIEHLKYKRHLSNVDKKLKFMEKICNDRYSKNPQDDFEK